MKKDKRVNTDKIKKRDNIFTIILSFCDVIAITVLFLLYGPYANFRDWLITTAMGTMNHQYLATTFYSMDKIEKVLIRGCVMFGLIDAVIVRPIVNILFVIFNFFSYFINLFTH